MSTQSEQALENLLVAQLEQLGYAKVRLPDEAALLRNLQSELETFNRAKFSETEFKIVLNHLGKGSIFERAHTLRDKFALRRDNGDTKYIHFFDKKDLAANRYQVTHQVTMTGTYKNRYDVTLLQNGIPVVQIELKRRGLEMKEAFNQIARYKRHSFWASYGLFQYVQLFVISNGVDTKYFCNNPLPTLNVKQTFYWAGRNNRNITDLTQFAGGFLPPAHLGRMLAHYIVRNETHKVLMVLRPYQYYAVEAILQQVRNSTENGYIWHTTGSGKTLTSFKASQLVTALPEVHKVVFVVDRRDLDDQTIKEFNAFKADSVDSTDNTRGLVKQLADDTPLVVTTIQKLNNAITNPRYTSQIAHLQLARVVFIFDECHRSQFGETHKRITSFFRNAQLFGFTGTPIFAANASGNALGKRTTKDLFGKRLHEYVITDAIRDQNVLRFNVEYIGRYRSDSKTFVDIKVTDIDRKEIFDDPVRQEKIVDYILKYHDQKTHRKKYSAMFAVSSIKALISYYEIFAAKKAAGEHDLRIATVYSWAPNPDAESAMGMLPDTDEGEGLSAAAESQAGYGGDPMPREKLEGFIADYNALFDQNFSTRDPKIFEGYYKDLSKRLKAREKVGFQEKDRLDILLVVNMFLTGFDAKMVNTLYVDKNLKQHGLIQAYSRTNRIINEQKSQGNILAFRNLKEATDEAVALFSDKNAKEDIFIPPYAELVERFVLAYERLMLIAPTLDSITDLPHEEAELEFIHAFRALMRLRNVLSTQVEFDWADLPMTEQEFADYASKYEGLRQKAKAYARDPDKASVLEDIDFEVELIHRDDINVAYILRLLAKLRDAKQSERAQRKKEILDLLGGEADLHSKRELIEKFIEEHLPHIDDLDTIGDEFEQFWQDEKTFALQVICDEEALNRSAFQRLVDTYVFSGREPLLDDVLSCLPEKPGLLQQRPIGQRILDKMSRFVETFLTGMVG